VAILEERSIKERGARICGSGGAKSKDRHKENPRRKAEGGKSDKLGQTCLREGEEEHKVVWVGFYLSRKPPIPARGGKPSYVEEEEIKITP